jgi:hypothetical protein
MSGVPHRHLCLRQLVIGADAPNARSPICVNLRASAFEFFVCVQAGPDQGARRDAAATPQL